MNRRLDTLVGFIHRVVKTLAITYPSIWFQSALVKKHPWLPGMTAVCLSWGLYFLWLWPHQLFTRADGVYAGWRTVWADWAAHYAYAGVFAYRSVGDWFVTNPLFIDGQFNYPFLADAITGVLMRLGVDTVSAFIIPSMMATLWFICVLFALYRAVFQSNKLAWLAVTLFMCSGGLGFIYFFQDWLQVPSGSTLWFPPREYTYLPAQHIESINFVSGELLPQRGILFGMPLALLIATLSWRWAERDFAGISYRHIALIGALSSLLILLHVHSLMALVGICGVLFCYYIRHYRYWLVMAAAAAVPNILLFIWLHGGGTAQNFIGWHIGWMANVGQDNEVNWLYFWLLNWGLLLPVAGYGILRYGWFRHPLVMAGVVIFVLCNLIQFQPWIWDNLKLLTLSYALLIIPVVGVLGQLWRRKTKVSRSISLILIVVLTLSGGLELWRLAQTDKLQFRMWDQTELALAKQLRDISQPTDVILTSDHHHHWVTSLTGRQVILGYKGWLFSYGIDYHQHDQDIRTMYAGGMMTEPLMIQYGVKYVVIGPSELTDYRANEPYFQRNHRLLISQGQYRVYQVVTKLRLNKTN